LTKTGIHFSLLNLFSLEYESEDVSQELFAAEIYRRLLHLHLHAQDLASAQAILNVHQI
jgi:hypothetical protein